MSCGCCGCGTKKPKKVKLSGPRKQSFLGKTKKATKKKTKK